MLNLKGFCTLHGSCTTTIFLDNTENFKIIFKNLITRFKQKIQGSLKFSAYSLALKIRDNLMKWDAL